MADAFAVMADPTRRRILDQLADGERNVSELADALDVRQPTVSKHLKVLRDAGFVACRVQAQHRVYRIDLGAFQLLDDWLDRFRERGPGGR